MKKKELLKRIEKLEETVKLLEFQLSLKQDKGLSWPSLPSPERLDYPYYYYAPFNNYQTTAG